MRSQTSKTLKKGVVSKTAFKARSNTKQVKKKLVVPKKGKNLANKTISRNAKKTLEDAIHQKNEDESSNSDKSDSSDSAKAGTSKASSSRSHSPTKKTKKDSKEKKESPKETASIKKVLAKKCPKKSKPPPKSKLSKATQGDDNDNIKYKINSGVPKKLTSTVSKAKVLLKKSNTIQKKKTAPAAKLEGSDKDDKKVEMMTQECKNKECDETISDSKIEAEKSYVKSDNKESPNNSGLASTITNPSVLSSTETSPKIEVERPPKFFTSCRPPRTVDIDVKCFKNSKGNLSVSERFLSMKCETKADENTKEKSVLNTLVTPGPEIDVYTFTEKVDSPKSILSGFRSPVNKNVGRVRPIARVKGTIIDKKEVEKKKYSPHRPIEEVVKQLKAKKGSEEFNSVQNDATSSLDVSAVDNTYKEFEEKPIVSKSYKMVARKSSITGKPFSPIKFLDQEPVINKSEKEKVLKTSPQTKKTTSKVKKSNKKSNLSDEDIDTSKFAFNTKSFHYTSSDESESNDDQDSKDSSGSESPKGKKTKAKKYKRITDGAKKNTSKELKELSKDSLIDLKDDSILLGGEKPSKRRLKLLSMWTGPKKHRMASLNAIAKVHCLYENESRTHMELGLMKTIDRPVLPGTSKATTVKKKESKPKEMNQADTTSESDYDNRKSNKKEDSSESSDDNPPVQRSLRGVPGIRSAGKYWDPKSSTSSSEDSELESKKKTVNIDKKKSTPKASSSKSDTEKPPAKMKKTAGVPVKKKRNRNEVVMDLKDMVVQKRMASLNATAILAASYEKRSPKSSKDDTTSDSCSDESFSQKPKNGVSSGVKSESKNEETKKEKDDITTKDRKQKVEVIVNQDTDVTITGVYSTHHHEGFCTVSGMQYRISSTSHTQTTATANCDKEGCTREDGARYTPLSALSSMQPPAEHVHTHPHPVTELGGLARRAAGCSAFSAPSPAAHHEPGYYQPAGPLIKEAGGDTERALARYHPPPHYHAPHPPVLQQYGPYYPSADLCYQYYRPPGRYHLPPAQPDAPMVGVGSDSYPPPQYYGQPPCYQHSPQRIPYVEYRGCPCPINACPKNVLIGPATGKAPTGGGPADVPPALAPPGGAFRAKVRACALDAVSDTHGSGKDPPLEPEPPAAADAPHPCPVPAIGGASPKREFDVRDALRLPRELPGPEPGPPSPARGSAGACAPQPPPSAPRRARLGKAMARRSLAGDDTGLLLQPPPASHSDADDDVLAISPPLCVPIDLSSSDERTTPLVDVKKENEGPTYSPPRKADTLALREHNIALIEAAAAPDTPEAVKRRYSRPKLEIEMKDAELEDPCRTNGIGEHVKLQKRRKVSSEQTETRIETVTREPKRKTQKPRRTPKTPAAERKSLKRKSDKSAEEPEAKKAVVEHSAVSDDPRLKNVAALPEDTVAMKPKTKSAVLLDNLLRKNSIDRLDAKGYGSDKEINPAELFFSPSENIAQTKKTLNINNNIVDTNGIVNGVRSTGSPVIEKKVTKKSCKIEKIDSKITHNLKSVLKPTEKQDYEEDAKVPTKCETEKNSTVVSGEAILTEAVKDKSEAVKDKSESAKNDSVSNKVPEVKKGAKKPEADKEDVPKETEKEADKEEAKEVLKPVKRCKLVDKVVGEKVKLFAKKGVIKTDEAALLVEDACASPTPQAGRAGRAARAGRARRVRRRRSLAGARRRRAAAPPPALAPEPRAPPRWSNGWTWDGEDHISKVYLNNDSRLDRTARCWSRMTHASGDRVARGDCVLLRASSARAQPFVARVARLWENPDDGEMMVSLVWYYRPEHTHGGRQPEDAPDEVFASRHRDANSVACIEDKCYVLTFNEYCRYRKRLKAAEEGVRAAPSIVPPAPAADAPAAATNDAKLPPGVSPELVLFCRKIYDFRSKKIQVPNK
ncbi:uncharacterized protein LOC133525708 isoform X2 [Cydia pomonella]|uniref:uncharacterized protein LOC133525708 isoform X2 n=1 Tax=Cydia pomonella TaxID=82600 RepID=UPI002ADE912A|nr:uncharacterized protein LOC133525708 isoform X2 [Cydia pomonella]